MLKIRLLYLLWLIPFLGFSQTTSHEKTTYVAPNGKLYWNLDLPVYLNVVLDSVSLKGHQLRHKADYAGAYFFKKEGLNSLKLPHIINKKRAYISYQVYADGTSPRTKVLFKEANSYKKAGTTYYGKGLQVKISASDAISGVKNTFYALNQNNYKSEQFDFAVSGEGKILLKSYSVDNVGNAEAVKEHAFTVDLTAPSTAHALAGKFFGNIIGKNTVLSLNSSDALCGVKQISYKLNGGKVKKYSGNKIPTSKLADGLYTIDYQAVDYVGNLEEWRTFEFYLDKSPPILAADALGDRFVVNNQIYFSGRTKLKLTVVDNKVGVGVVNYSVDGKPYQAYSQPFYLPSVSGYHFVKYNAADKLGNATREQKTSTYDEYDYNVSKIYVDLTGPILSHRFVGDNFVARDTFFINSQTKIKLQAHDKESGLQYISYSVDNQREETVYKEPFSLQGTGKHLVEYFAYDQVNNRNRKNFIIKVDNQPPEIRYFFSIPSYKTQDGLPVYPAYANLYLAAIDQKVGADKIYYTLNANKERLYASYLKGFAVGVNVLKIRAIDKLHNDQEIEIKFFIEK